MRLTAKASLAFKKLKAAEKPNFGTNVINSLTPVLSSKKTKGTVQDLPVPVAELTILNTALATAVSDSLTGNHTAVASVKNAVAAWDVAFTSTANFITLQAAGDEMLIRQAGFVPTKTESTPKQKPGAAANFKATINGSKGAIIAGSKVAVPGACSYIFCALPDGVSVNYVGETMIITAGDKNIYLSATTSRQTELYNLPSGVLYNVSMYAVNSAGSGPASAPQQVIPQ